MKDSRFLYYTRVRVEGTLEHATKDDSTKPGIRASFARKSRVDEEEKLDGEEEVYLVMGTESFHLVPLDMAEH